MTTQAFHNRLVSQLMRDAMGDLMLVPGNGALAYRETYDEATGRYYPRDISKPREVLARISGVGWTLTPAGAQFILENCEPAKRDVRGLLAIAERKAAPALELRITDATQYATLYSNGQPVATFTRHRVMDRTNPAAWRVSDLRGREVFAFTRSDTPRAMARLAFQALESSHVQS